MSAIFPHQAVTERYLHTGGRRGTSRKVVVATFFAGVACAVVVANLPAGSSAGSSTPSGPQVAKRISDGCRDRTWPYNRCANTAAREGDTAPVRDVAAAPSAATQDAATVAESQSATIGQGSSRVDAMPRPADTAAAPNPPVPPAPESPAPLAQANPTPAPEPARHAAPDPAPAAEPAKPATSASAAEESARKPPPPRVAHKAAATRRVRAEQRVRAARLRQSRIRAAGLREGRDVAQPTMVRVYDLPDGRRIYQRVHGDEPGLGRYGAPVRRVYLAPTTDAD